MFQEVKIAIANIPMNESANGNRGCQALGYTTMYIIDNIFKKANRPYTLYALDTGYNDNEEHFIIIEGKKIFFRTVGYPQKGIKGLVKTIIHPLKEYRNVTILRKIDHFLDIGQGDSFSDIYGKSRFDSIDRIHQLASKYNKKYCLLPQTIGPFINESIKNKALLSISNAALTMARDFQSFSYIKNALPSYENCKEYLDVAFFMPYEKKVNDSRYTHIGLNVSALLHHGGYTKNNQFKLSLDYQSLVFSVIDYFLSFPDVKVHLVGHVIRVEESVENDYRVLYDIYRKYYYSDKCIMSPLFLNPIDAKSYISGLDFFIGARMHATIAAFSSGVPVVPMAYSRKFNGLFEDTLDYPYMVDMKVQTNEEALATIKEAFTKRGDLKEIINDRMNSIVKEREKLMYDDLRRYFKINN